uniref:Uncharacterized protein n=1 Tax=Glossina palpalis gambiensis TaxID=67801 RepID=A0A1B0AYU9_9MUSC
DYESGRRTVGLKRLFGGDLHSAAKIVVADWQLIMIFLASTTTHIVHNKQHKHLRSSKIFCLGYESLTKDSSHKVYDISRKSAECHQ